MKSKKDASTIFATAYSIKGKGVGHLELSKARKSKAFTSATKSLAEKIQEVYGKETVLKGTVDHLYDDVSSQIGEPPS